jgi:hypothetical protein
LQKNRFGSGLVRMSARLQTYLLKVAGETPPQGPIVSPQSDNGATALQMFPRGFGFTKPACALTAGITTVHTSPIRRASTNFIFYVQCSVYKRCCVVFSLFLTWSLVPHKSPAVSVLFFTFVNGTYTMLFLDTVHCWILASFIHRGFPLNK